MQSYGFPVYNYSDNLIGISASLAEAEAGYNFLCALLNDLGLPASAAKLCPPTRCMTCLGIGFDVDNAYIRIPPAKLHEIMTLCELWHGKTKVTKNSVAFPFREIITC